MDVFSVSSYGGSATLWFCHQLNRQPNTICFHSLRQDPFVDRWDVWPPGKDDVWPPIAPELMMRGLTRLRERTYSDKTFGIVHAYFAASPLKAILRDHGGGFAVMSRDPLCRLHSLFSQHYQVLRKILAPDRPIIGDIYEDYYDLSEEATSDRTLLSSGIIAIASEQFRNMFADIVAYDFDYYINCQDDEIIRYESIVADPAYFRTTVARLIGTDPGKVIVDEANYAVPLNSHAGRRFENSAAVWRRLPPAFQAVIAEVLAGMSHGLCRVLYDAMGYDPVWVDWATQEIAAAAPVS